MTNFRADLSRRISRFTAAAVFAASLALGSAFAGDAPAGTPVPDAEADKLLDAIIAKIREIVRVEADLVTTKENTAFKGTRIAHEHLKLEAPDKVLMVGRGDSEKELPPEQCTIFLLDSVYLWEAQPKEEGTPRDVSRRKLKDNEGKTGGSGLAGFLSMFLLGGKDAATAQQLRDEFDITTFSETDEGGASTHFVMKPKKEGETVDLWFRPDSALPWKIRSIEKKKIITVDDDGAEKFKLTVETRELRDLKTNLTGLAPFPPEAFLFPLTKDAVVVDEEGDELAPSQVAKDIQAVREKQETVRREREAAPKDKP